MRGNGAACRKRRRKEKRHETYNGYPEKQCELQKELCKSLRSGADRQHISEEIADVQIMLEQMMMLYECHEDVAIWRKKKVVRLHDRLIRDGCIGGNDNVPD